VGSWEELDLGLRRPLEAMPYGLAFSGETLVVALRDGRLLASDDAGDRWHSLEAEIPRVVAIAAA
jgi:hypothetical protein